MGDVILSLRDIFVEFDGEVILNKINLDIKDKEFVTLLGPSGCGKTTTLRIIGGFLDSYSGDVYFNGECINKVPAHKRNVNTVFQKYALFPHMNVFDNVAFGLKLKKLPKAEIEKKVRRMLAIVDLKGYEKRPISKLSGGQQQRVAIARALVCEPKVLLLDEPLGALDLKLRKDMQIELKKLQQQLQTTFIYVTHDQEEALTMSDTVVVMNNGNIEMVGSPTDVYNEPANAFVADFIGEANILNGIMLEDYKVKVQDDVLECEDCGFGRNHPVDVVIRPEDIEVTKPEDGQVRGVVVDTIFKGVHYEMSVNCGGCMWLIHSTVAQPVGKEIGMRVIPYDIHIMEKLLPYSENTFKAEVVSNDPDSNSMQIQLENSVIDVENRCFEKGSVLEITVSPSDVYISGEEKGHLEAYIESVIYKGVHNEIILETDEHKWLVSSDIDEQIATYVQMKINFENAEFKLIGEAEK